MNKGYILVVDDEEDILELLRYNLARNGYPVICAESGEKAVGVIRERHPDLVILDLMLPGIDGLDVCRKLKNEQQTKGIPIIMLSARGEEADIVTGLELGADDYITKPFSPRVLLARVRAVLRRRDHDSEQPEALIKIHDIVINPARHEARAAGGTLNLTAAEFRLLSYLAGRPGWVFTRTQIVNAVHGEDYAVTDRSVDVLVMGLRKKLGPAGAYIETVRGVGYRFRDEI